MGENEGKVSVFDAILSFLFWPAGLIIFIVNKKKNPKNSKVCAICTLAGAIISVIIRILMTRL